VWAVNCKCDQIVMLLELCFYFIVGFQEGLVSCFPFLESVSALGTTSVGLTAILPSLVKVSRTGRQDVTCVRK